MPSPKCNYVPTPVARVEWILLVVAATVLVGFRLHAFDLPLENDECNYAYIAGRLLAGERLYVDVWDHQPPGVFVLYAGAINLFGESPNAFRCMTAGFALTCLVLVFLFVRRIAGPIAALGAAFLYAVVSSDPGSAGEGCNREIYMNAMILGAWYCGRRGIDDRRSWKLAAAGLLLAFASCVKTIAAVHWIVLACWIVGVTARNDGHNRTPRAIQRFILFASPPALLWLAVYAYFLASGRAGEFIDAVFRFNLSYSGADTSFFHRFAQFFSPPRHRGIFDSAAPLWIAGLFATIWLTVASIRTRDQNGALVVLLVLAGFVAICLPGRFWPHYYHLLIPPLVIATAVGCGRFTARHPARSEGVEAADRYANCVSAAEVPGRWRRRMSIGVGALIVAATLATQYQHYLSRPPFGITVHRYNSRDFWGRAQGENVRRVTDPNDTIFVYGNDAEIYYYAQRRCASRFTMITGIQSVYAGADKRRRIMMDELRANPPRLIIVLFDEPPFDEWLAFLRWHYGDPVGWDFHDRRREAIMCVQVRRDAPIESIDWNWDREQVGGWFPGEEPARGLRNVEE